MKSIFGKEKKKKVRGLVTCNLLHIGTYFLKSEIDVKTFLYFNICSTENRRWKRFQSSTNLKKCIIFLLKVQTGWD